MRRSLLVPLVLVAGLALVVGLFFVFRSGSDDGAADNPSETVTVDTKATATATTERTTTAAATTEAAEPGSATLEVVVRDGRPEGGIQHLTVDRGDRVSVDVTSDVADEVHVHGYDLMQDVAPGAPAEISFTATIAGRFEIELEERGTPIAEIEVR